MPGRLNWPGCLRYGVMAEATRDVLAAGEVLIIPLKEYTGRPGDQVKVGTFHRAKGLELAYVFIPDRDRCRNIFPA